MDPENRFLTFRAPLVALISAGFLSALSMNAQTAGPKPEDEKDVLVLSPFVVTAEKDTGYSASATLAGSRLRTDLKDIAASVTVLTKDLFEDTGSTNIRDILVYVAGTEVSGIGGNYSDTGKNLRGFTEELYTVPAATTRVRGLAAADTTRDFFSTPIPLDEYNIDRVEVNRGANSALFGLGSPAGIINYALKRAEFRNFNTIGFKADEFGSTRVTLHGNVELIDKTLAFRISAVRDNKKFEQEPAFEDTTRLFGAVHFSKRLFKGNAIGQTSFRANYEYGKIDSNRPRSLPPSDLITSWFDPYDIPGWDAPAKQTWNPSKQAHAQPHNPTAGQWRTLGLVANVLRNPTLIYPDPTQDVASDPYGQGVQGRQGVVSNLAGVGTSTFYTPIGVDQVVQLLNLPGGSYYNGSLLLDRSIFDYRKKLMEGPNKHEDFDFRTYNLTFEQLFWGDRAGIEVSYDNQHATGGNYSILGFANLYTIYIDVNTHLSDGTVNANFGRPFVASTGAVRKNSNDKEAFRVTPFVKADFTGADNRWVRWLGRHNLTGVLSQAESKDFNADGYLYYAGPEYTSGGSNDPLDANSRSAAFLHYIGPSLANANTAAGANLSNLSVLQSIPSAPIIRSKPTPAGAAFRNEAIPFLPNAWRSGSRTRNEVDSIAAILQSYLAREHIVTTLSWREDSYASYSAGAPRLGANGIRMIDEVNFPVLPKATLEQRQQSTGFGVVGHLPELIVKHLPSVSRLSLKYNRSENFTPTSARKDFMGNIIGAPSGNNKEFGFTAALFKDKLQLSATRYETSQTGQTVGSNPSLISIYQRALQNSNILGLNPVGPNRRPLSPTTGAELPAFPQAHLDLFNFAVNPDGSTSYTGNPEVVWTTDFVAKGTEIELVYNPTRNWRIMANVARQESVRSNTSQQFEDFLSAKLLTGPNGQPMSIRDAWYGDWANVAINESRNTLKGELSAIDAGLAATRLQDGGPARELRKWRVNLVSNYTFSDGVLKGFKVGGAYRWQDGAALGYPLITGPTGGLIPDVKHPYIGDIVENVDTWIGYEKALKGGRKWRIQLNVRNLLDDNKLIPVGINPGGAVIAWQIGRGRSYDFSTSFDF